MSELALAAWGWDARADDAWATLPPDVAGLAVPARVIAEHRGAWDVETAAGALRAGTSGALRRTVAAGGPAPAVGDWVAVDPGRAGTAPTVVAVLPRRTAFVRREPGREAGAQVVAANVDLVLVVTAVGRDVNARRIERYLAVAAASGAEPLVVVNKADLRDGLADALRVARQAAGAAPVVAASARTREGVDVLAARAARGATVALLGSSGVGKSSLVNTLLGEDRLDTGVVRADDERGRHTTTARMLVRLPAGGCLLDTPGMRELGMAGTEAAGALDAVFGDVAALAERCRFVDCEHRTEPGCAVRTAIEAGDLAAERLESHRRLAREARASAARLDARSRAEERREARRRGAMYREILRAKYGQGDGGW